MGERRRRTPRWRGDQETGLIATTVANRWLHSIRTTNRLDSLALAPILNHMVKFYTMPLDRTFAALSDATRRALVMRLAQEPGVSISELAAPFEMSLPAIMKHLDVLSDAGLLPRIKHRSHVGVRS